MCIDGRERRDDGNVVDLEGCEVVGFLVNRVQREKREA